LTRSPRELQRQSQDPTSLLRNGRFTCLTTYAKVQDKEEEEDEEEESVDKQSEARDGDVMLEALRELELLRGAHSEAASKVRGLEDSARMMDRLLVQTQDYRSKLEEKLDANRSWTNTLTYIHVHTYMYILTYMCTYTCVHRNVVCVCVCVCVCNMYICTRIYIHTTYMHTYIQIEERPVEGEAGAEREDLSSQHHTHTHSHTLTHTHTHRTDLQRVLGEKDKKHKHLMQQMQQQMQHIAEQHMQEVSEHRALVQQLQHREENLNLEKISLAQRLVSSSETNSRLAHKLQVCQRL
jgi:hypothetical protein